MPSAEILSQAVKEFHADLLTCWRTTMLISLALMLFVDIARWLLPRTANDGEALI